MEKRMLIALGLSLLILMVFQKFYIKPKTGAVQAPASAVATAGGTTVQTADKPRVFETPQEAPARPIQENESVILTDNFKLVFSSTGGTLKELTLIDGQQGEKEELLIKEAVPSLRPFAMASGRVPDLANREFAASKGKDFLEYKFTEPGAVEITKRFTFDKALDCIVLQVSIKSLASRTAPFSYQMVGPSGMVKSSQIKGRSFLEADAMIDGKVWKAKSVKGSQERGGNISWVALKNRYYSLILKPLSLPASVQYSAAAKKQIVTALNSRDYELSPGKTIEEDYVFYAGPLNEKRIQATGYDLTAIIDYGFFGGVSKALLTVLRFFHRISGNWGVAIILLTLTVNIILFPLTMKSFASMQQMKKVQPHMQKLKEIHKDNPQKLNKEMMELYKQYNVNPLGGCLPLLLQMPIFIALYQGLIRSIELKGAGFLWIKDLARPDAVPIPFKLPLLGSSINILPLLMVGVMVLQQRISQAASSGAMTDDQAQQQKMMMIMFPLFFGFLFYSMPSGLVLYWLTNTILMTTEQSLIGRRMSRA